MDYRLLIDAFIAQHIAHQPNARAPSAWSGQRLLHESLRQAIRAGHLAAGTRLLASRVLAAELGIARNSVLYAYEQLATEGLVSAGKRGTRVTPLQELQLLQTRQIAPTAGRSATQAALSARSAGLACLPLAADVASAFAPGVPALNEFPLALWRRLSARAWGHLSPAQLNYGPAAGEEPLRRAIAEHLRASRGVRCAPAQVFITDGTQASLDLCARAFADAGDKVWIENPGYGGAVTAFRAAQLKIIGIPVDADGMAASTKDWRQHRPKLIYVTPSHQYPCGGVMSLERRLALIAQARAAGALIIEDDYDSEFRYGGPPLAAMQGQSDRQTEGVGDAPVVYLGTFSKTLFPGLRIGFAVVPTALVEPLSKLLARSAPRGRSADQLALAEFLRQGHFGLHLRRMRRLYRQRRDALMDAVAQHLSPWGSVHGASAGIHLVLRFHPDAGLDDTAISLAALQAGIVAPSLSQHQVGRRAHGWRGLMIGYAQVPAEQMEPLVRRLAALLEEAREDTKLQT